MSKFLNTTPVRTIASAVLQFASVFLIHKEYFLAAQISAVVASVLAGMDVPKFTTWFQFILNWTAALVLGQNIEYGSGNFPLLTIALFLCMTSILLRLIFYTSMMHTRYMWLDPLVMFFALACYFSGNIIYGYSWQGWVFPVFTFAFCLQLIAGFIKENKAYRIAGKAGYRAEIGKPAPDFSLPDPNGNNVILSDFIGKRHVLLLFVRGDWCPACHMMLRAYESGREKLQEKNVFLLAIGPDPVGVNKNMAERIGVDYSILADDTQQTTKMYGVHLDKDPISRKTGIADGGLPLPASFLVCDKGIVRYHSSPERVGEFLNPALIFDELAKI